MGLPIAKFMPNTQVSDPLLQKNSSNYWLFTVGTASTETVFYYPTLDFDSSGNIYVLGNNTYFYKINAAQKKLDYYKQISGSSSGSVGNYDDLIYDRTNDRIYISGYSTISATNRTHLIRINAADGSPHSATRLQITSGQSNVSTNHSMALDSSGNVYVPYYETGKGTGGAYYKAGYLKFSAALGFTSRSELFQAGNFYDYDGKVRIDSSNNVYFINTTNYNTETKYAIAVSKRDSAGTQSWTPRRLYNNSTYTSIYYADGDMDSNGNTFGMGFSANTNSGNVGIVVAKWNSGGTIQWRRLLSLTSKNLQTDNGQQRKVTTDSSGNVYVGFSDATNGDVSYVARYNSDGTLSWVMEISFGYEARGNGTSGDEFAQIYGGSPTLRVFNDNLYFLGVAYTRTVFGDLTLDNFICKLPIDKVLIGRFYTKRNNFLTIKDVTASFTSADSSSFAIDEAYTAATHTYSTSPVNDSTAVTMTFTDKTAYECSFIPLAN